MANRPLLAVTGLAASSVLLSASITGCHSNTSSTASSSASSSSASASASSNQATASSGSAAPSEYSGLLIAATDINVPNDTFIADTPDPNPWGKPGIRGTFSNAAGTRGIEDIIMILPDESGAAAALEDAKANLGSSVTGAPQPASVGSNGIIASGASPDNSKSVTVLLFTEGKAFTTIDLDGAPNDPVPPEIVADIGQKQDAAIKAGLHG